jgi:hypothetical protein
LEYCTKDYPKKLLKLVILPKNARLSRGRAAAIFYYNTLLEICQALFIRQIKQKILGGQSEVFCPFCFTGWQLMASLPRTATEGDSGTPPLGWG